jgi:Tfp pilus assembly protein FimV
MHPAVPPSVYRRRRVVAALLAVTTLFAVWNIAQTVSQTIAASDAQPMQTISATQPLADAGAEYWTVRPGDTLWSIAQAVTPKGDIRPVLKRLDARYGSSPLVAGQNILVS